MASAAQFLPERRFACGSGYVQTLLREWSQSSTWPEEKLITRYAEAMALPFVAHGAVEYHRWWVRSTLRSQGRRLTARLAEPIKVPTLYVRGERDGCVLEAASRGSGARCSGAYTEHTVAGAGHFVHEQAPEQTNALVLTWLAQVAQEVCAVDDARSAG